MKENISKNSLKEILEIKEYKNKYRLAAEEIYASLGVGNYSQAYNCMTRFRVNVIDKNLVNIEMIKQIPVVKGINWNGPELQIIIGGEVIKVIDEFKKYEIEATQPKLKLNEMTIVKMSLGSRIMAAIVGIMQPSIGIIVAGGMLVAIYSLLTLPDNNLLTTSVANPYWYEGANNIPKTVGIDMGTLYLFDLWSAIFFVLSKVIMSSIGIFFIYNTVRYFKGNRWFAIAIGVFLLSRAFFPNLGPSGLPMGQEYEVAQFGDWTTSSEFGKTGFLLFKIGTYPVMIMGYEGSIIPYIVGGLLIVYLDKWIKTWMPTSIDITFRAMLVVLFTMFGLWFILAPLASLVEYGLFFAMTWFGNIPYGFGTGIFAMLWQPLVIIGCHTPLGIAADVAIQQGTPQLLGTANVTPYWGQLGAVIAIGLISKNTTLKRASFGTVPAGIFGITEPIIYGVNLPRLTPFLYGCAGAAVGGFLIGILNLDMDLNGTFGLLSILRFTGNDKMSQGTEVGLLVMTWAITFAVGFILTFFFYKERKDELTYFKKSINKLTKSMALNKDEVNKEFESDTNLIKSMKKDYEKMDKYYAEISKFENQLLLIENKESKQRQKMYKQLLHLKNKLLKKDNAILLNKFKILNDKYSDYSLDKEKEVIQTKLNNLMLENEHLLQTFTQNKENIYENSVSIINSHQVEGNSKLKIENMIWNSLNSVEIGFEIEDAKPTRFKKEAK